MEQQTEHLTLIVEQMADTVISASETIEHLSKRMNDLTLQVQQQGKQVSALTESLQTLTDNQETLVAYLAQFTETLQHVASSLDSRQKI